MKKIAILQSNYIPWKGVFDMMNKVDIFVFFEDVDFTKRDWRIRNKIKTPEGEIWLTIPVKKASRGTKIHEIQISQEENWQEKHYKTITQYYKKARYFEEYKWLLDKIYLEKKWENLSEFNIFSNILIAKELGIKAEFINSKDLKTSGTKDDKLIEICEKLGGNYYLSGPAAKDYINNEKFKNKNINLAYIKYEYPEYKQLYGEFNHYLSIFDVLFNCGKDTQDYIFTGRIEEVKL
ncbi:WbqC family protein [Fusobacterium ulcerans]|uniref:WbqC family protein n=1 Tax=Fusobacterium ulcerans TaxID=861 RepID=UPI001D09D2F2|nr:WbqC family protein [Fusobacterium ulcerans]MCB8566037.1 WbqC family protein [Fusobacterium ulcerans]MCB8650044.1 WbqC family protein [Fusobacterium ulcerans]